MQTWKIDISKPAQRFIDKQDKATRRRIYSAIYRLPNSGDIKPMSGHPGLYRLRVGDYRVLYREDHGKLVIYVIDAGNRGDIYKGI